MKTTRTENKVYEASKFNSWEEVIEFIRKNLDMTDEPYKFNQEVSTVPPESIQLSLYERHDYDDDKQTEDEPIYRMKIVIRVDENNTLKDLIELQIYLLKWLNNLYTVYNDYSLDEYRILYKSNQGYIELFKYETLEEE